MMCETEFYRSPSKNGLFCGRKCKEQAQKERLIGVPDHYGTGVTRYRTKAFDAMPAACIDCGYDNHASVLEVHHLDGDRSNPNNENLVIVCPTCHTERHLGLRPNTSYAGEVIEM